MVILQSRFAQDFDSLPPWPDAAKGTCQDHRCGQEGTDAHPLLPCDACGDGMHRDCAGFSKHAHAFNRGFVCPLCRVTRLDVRREMRPDLPNQGLSHWEVDKRIALMRAANIIQSKAWSDPSWSTMSYHLRKVIDFERDTGIAVLPMDTERMMAYFAHLITISPTWRAVRAARTAIRAWHIVAKLPDPFIGHPERTQFLTGLKRVVTLYSKKKLGLSIEQFLQLFWGAFSNPRSSFTIRLRDAVWLILGFFGFRRHSEVVLGGGPGNEKGLRMKDVTFFPDHVAGRCVRLWIRRMKNDTFGKGHFVWLCDRTASGVPIYDIFWAYALAIGYLQDSDLPFVQGTCGKGRFDGRQLYQYRGRLKVLMQRHLPFLTDVDLRDYSAHSLRRGGCSHAFHKDVHWDLVNVHGSWLGGTAITGYRYPKEEHLVSVTQRM
jgi:hypothetical protein